MPRYLSESDSYHCPPDVVRVLRRLNGTPKLRIQFNPQLGYAEHPTKLTRHRDYLKAQTTLGAHESVYLYTDSPLMASSAPQELSLERDTFLWLSYNQKLGIIDLERAELEFERTKVYWLNWCTRTATTRAHADVVRRSALVLKLLSFQETGAILAAPTTSLPEAVGEERNWDYRFCWIRDASMVIRTLVTLGHDRVARRFFQFLLDVVPYKNNRIQIMYGIRGQRQLEEITLDWLSGYENSRPVRLGNAAWSQQQNDIYGVLLDVVHQGFVQFRGNASDLEALWTMTRGIVRQGQVLGRPRPREQDRSIARLRGLR